MATEEKRIRLRGDTAANWSNVNPTLAEGEVGVEFGATPADTKFKIGDGTTIWSVLPYFSGGGAGAAEEIDFAPQGSIEAITVQAAVVEAAADAAGALATHAALVAGSSSHLPNPGTVGQVLTVVGGSWASADPSGGTAESIAVMEWDAVNSEYVVAASNPSVAAKRWWVGPVKPKASTGTYSTAWAEGDFYTDTST
jgi:hypothetical protein